MSLSDTGDILFPSITVCKDEMYTSREEGALFTRLDSGQYMDRMIFRIHTLVL